MAISIVPILCKIFGKPEICGRPELCGNRANFHAGINAGGEEVAANNNH